MIKKSKVGLGEFFGFGAALKSVMFGCRDQGAGVVVGGVAFATLWDAVFCVLEAASVVC